MIIIMIQQKLTTMPPLRDLPFRVILATYCLRHLADTLKVNNRVLWLPPGTLYLEQEVLVTLRTPYKRDTSGISSSNWDKQWPSRTTGGAWRRSTAISHTSPPDVTSSAPVVPMILPDTDLKDFLNGSLPQAYKDICRKSQYNILKHSISDALDYLQNPESNYANSTTTVLAWQSSSSGGNPKRGNGKGECKT